MNKHHRQDEWARMHRDIGRAALVLGLVGVALLGTAVLIACSRQADSVAYQRHDATFVVHLVLADQVATRRQCVKLGTWGSADPAGPGPFGCNVFDPVSNAVIIYATAPEQVDDAYTTLLGHELLHAYGGAYHAGYDQ